MTTNGTHPADLVLAVVTGTIGALGIPGNMFLMFLILSEQKKRKPHEWLFFASAFGDLLLCINNASLEAPYIVNPNTVQCEIAAAADYIFGMISFLTPPLVAYNRYLSLYHNQKYQRIFTNRNVLFTWMMCCLFAVLWVSPFIMFESLGQDDVGLCGLQLNNPYLTADMVLGCLVAMGSNIILAYFAYMVTLKIRDHKKNVFMQSRMQSRLINESQEIITALILSSGVPFFAQIPCALMKLLQAFMTPFDPWISRLATAPFPLTAAINAYVTVYVVKAYRRKTKGLFKKPSFVTPAVGGWSVHAVSGKPIAS